MPWPVTPPGSRVIASTDGSPHRMLLRLRWAEQLSIRTMQQQLMH